MEFKRELGPGDENYWTDVLDVNDKVQLIFALTDGDNPFFDIDLLRTLVKEYYAYKIENAWWKGMGYEEGKLTVMRLKQKELAKARYQKPEPKQYKKVELILCLTVKSCQQVSIKRKWIKNKRSKLRLTRKI